jgi:hypothetical protein
MTRRFLDDVRADIHAIIKTNGNAEITGPLLNGLMIDMIDSTINDECALIQTTDEAYVTSITFEPIDNYDSSVGGDGDFLTPDILLGTIKSSPTSGWTYDVEGQISFIAQNNADYEFTMLRNGAPSGFLASITGTGNNDLQTLSVNTTILSNVADNFVSLGFRSITGGNSITITNVVLKAVIKPTNNP